MNVDLGPVFLAEARHSVGEASVHIVVTVLLSLFAFTVFRVKNRLVSFLPRGEQYREQASEIKARLKSFAILLVAFPSSLYALFMRNDYVPAVFTMAIIAIIVAADHEAELDEAPEILAERTSESLEIIKHDFDAKVDSSINRVSQVIKAVDDSISKLEASLTQVNQEVEKIGPTIQRMALYTDTYTWPREINRIQRQSEAEQSHVDRLSSPDAYFRLSAAIRHFEVDLEWLQKGTRDCFYKGDIYEALSFIHQSIRGDRSGSEDRPVVRDRYSTISYAKFVAQGPSRLQFWRPNNHLEARFFFGLLYVQCMTYWVALKDRELSRPARIRIGVAPHWVHVINDDVWQMIETRETTVSLARRLHDEFAPSPRLSPHESATAHEDIVITAYSRSVRAEPYIASMMLATQRPKGELPLDAPPTPETLGNWILDPADLGEGFAFCLEETEIETAYDKMAAFIGAEDTLLSTLLARELTGVRMRHGDENTYTRDAITEIRKRTRDQFRFLLREYIMLRCHYLQRGVPETSEELRSFLHEEVSA